MALRSPVGWALLGLVIQRPSYGYELLQRFERTFGDALELSSPSQVYNALDALSKRELIEEVDLRELEVVRQPKPHYRATAAGVRSYREWLTAQVHEERRRARLFARQLVVLDAEEALAVIDRYEQACLAEAAAAPLLTSEEHQIEGVGGLAGRLLHEEDRLAIGAKLSFVEYARRELTAIVGPQGGKP